jgi:hypothetical protein
VFGRWEGREREREITERKREREREPRTWAGEWEERRKGARE